MPYSVLFAMINDTFVLLPLKMNELSAVQWTQLSLGRFSYALSVSRVSVETILIFLIFLYVLHCVYSILTSWPASNFISEL